MTKKMNWCDTATDPVVVGLGRILIGVGLLVVTGMVTLAWMILSRFA